MTDAQLALLILNAWLIVGICMPLPHKARAALYNASFWLFIWLWAVLR